MAPALVSKIENTLAYMVQGTVVFEISYTTILLLPAQVNAGRQFRGMLAFGSRPVPETTLIPIRLL